MQAPTITLWPVQDSSTSQLSRIGLGLRVLLFYIIQIHQELHRAHSLTHQMIFITGPIPWTKLKQSGMSFILLVYITLKPEMIYLDIKCSILGFATFRMNTSAGAARPNPQGSFHYGSINITHTYVIRSAPLLYINEKRRSTLNGISYTPPDTPLRLADLHKLEGVYTLDFPPRPKNSQPQLGRSAINASDKGFIEIVFQNNDTRIHTYHLDGYAFFVVGYVLVSFSLFFFY